MFTRLVACEQALFAALKVAGTPSQLACRILIGYVKHTQLIDQNMILQSKSTNNPSGVEKSKKKGVSA